ncbi:MAG: hypothetical protein H0W22_03360, partial [Chloroflexi bacterium]|nr:hypothetical protein [Chloroflexota bacterium]
MRRLLTFALAIVLSLATASTAMSAEPGELRERDAQDIGRAKAADILGRKPDGVHRLDAKASVTSVDGRRYWTGV